MDTFIRLKNRYYHPFLGLFLAFLCLGTILGLPGVRARTVQAAPDIVFQNLVAHLFASDPAVGDEFGFDVAIDGGVAVITAAFDDIGLDDNQGSAYIFYQDQGTPDLWTEFKELTASDGSGGDLFGWSAAIYANTVAIGSPNASNTILPDQGAVYIFERDQGGSDNWGQVKDLLCCFRIRSFWQVDCPLR